MIKLSQKQQEILAIILRKKALRSSEIHAEMLKLEKSVSLVTIKRTLAGLVSGGVLIVSGSGRSTSYSVSIAGRIFAEIDAHKYCSVDPDKRYGFSRYNFDLFSNLPLDIFTAEELKIMDNATAKYQQRIKDLSATIQKKELERLVIELSWKSSKIEGNTYTLLDTEKLILENKQAVGKTKQEAQMILNHKDAFNFVRGNKDKFKTLTRKNLEELHSILVKDLGVDLGLRKKPVGITGSLYRPLDNIYQITEAVDVLGEAITKMPTAYAKAMMALLGISYIQPFADGNKRTSRLMANALLLAYGSAPLSYRSIDENDYREAMLVFYELNSITPFKQIFISQYDFAAENYAVK